MSRPAIPSARAAPVDRSMQRPFTKGPRSLTRTVTLRPLECEVTVTSEPNDLVRWAAVIALGFIRSPEAVRPLLLHDKDGETTPAPGETRGLGRGRSASSYSEPATTQIFAHPCGSFEPVAPKKGDWPVS